MSLRCVFTSVRKGHPGLPVVANAVASPQVLIAQATSSVFPHDRNAKVVSDAPVPSCKPLEFHTLSSVKGVVRNWLKHHKSATHSGAREACWYMVLVQIESRASHTVCYKGTQDADARVKESPLHGYLRSGQKHQIAIALSHLLPHLDPVPGTDFKLLQDLFQANLPLPNLLFHHSYAVEMISDNQLYTLALFLGSAAMLMIVLYHFLEVNAIDTAEGEDMKDEKTGVGAVKPEKVPA